MQKQPPSDLVVEANVLGSILIDPESLDYATIAPTDFYSEKHRIIYSHMLKLRDELTPIDLATLADSLRKTNELEKIGSVPYLIGLADGVTTAAYFEDYQAIVKEKARARDAIAICGQALQMLYDNADTFETTSSAAQSLADLSVQTTSEHFQDMREAGALAFERIVHLREIGSAITGIPSGIAKIDEQTRGLQPHSYNVLAGRPAMGKTAMMLQLALEGAKHFAERGTGQSVLIFSLEMDTIRLYNRILAMMSGVDANKISSPALLTDYDMGRLKDCALKLNELKIYFDDASTLTPSQLKARVRRMALRKNAGMVFIDYLQIMEDDSPNGNAVQEMTNISRAIMHLKKELPIAFVALSQLNRGLESRPNKRPLLSDLRQSGAIEQDADNIFFLYRDKYYNPESPDSDITEFIHAKARDNSSKTVPVVFHPTRVRFVALDDKDGYHDWLNRNKDQLVA